MPAKQHATARGQLLPRTRLGQSSAIRKARSVRPVAPQKLLSVRLPGAQLRQLKSRAADQGLSLQAAVGQAVDSWLANPVPRLSLEEFFRHFEGTMPDGDWAAERALDRELEFARDARLMAIGGPEDPNGR